MSIVPLTIACFMQAAQFQGLPPTVMLTILKIEGGKVGTVSKNTNGTEDLGPMQVNTGVWLKPVADMHFKGDKDAAYAALRDNGCYNVNVAAWILRQAIDDANGNVFEGVGYYHSRTTKHKTHYQGLFAKNYTKMFGAPGAGTKLTVPAPHSQKLASNEDGAAE